MSIDQLKKKYSALKKKQESLVLEKNTLEASLRIVSNQVSEKEQALFTKYNVKSLSEAEALIQSKTQELEDLLAKAEKVLGDLDV